MGHRQLALLFAVLTAIVVLAYTALRLQVNIAPAISMVVLIGICAISSFLLLFIAKKKWELGYLNALIMLVSSSVVYALIFAFSCKYVYMNFHRAGSMELPSFGALFVVNFFIRIPIDAVVAIFWKRKA